MVGKNNSLMVVLDQNEYCFLYDTPSFPDVLESILDTPGLHTPCEDSLTKTGELKPEQAREIARGLIGKFHQEL